MNLINDDNEILDLVDEQDCVIGQLERSQVYAQKLSNFRVINAFLVNPEGQLWIPRRTAQKRLAPLSLDVGVGGHVGSGESYEQALIREVMEEVNIDLSTHQFQLLGKLTPHEHGVTAFLQVYKIFVDKAPQYNPDDFMEYFWLTPEQALDKIAAGDKAKCDLSALLRFFQKNAY